MSNLFLDLKGKSAFQTRKRVFVKPWAIHLLPNLGTLGKVDDDNNFLFSKFRNVLTFLMGDWKDVWTWWGLNSIYQKGKEKKRKRKEKKILGIICFGGKWWLVLYKGGKTCGATRESSAHCGRRLWRRVEAKQRLRWSTPPHGSWRLSAPSLSPSLFPSSACCTFLARHVCILFFSFLFLFPNLSLHLEVFPFSVFEEEEPESSVPGFAEGEGRWVYFLSLSLSFPVSALSDEDVSDSDGGFGAELMLLGFISLLLTVFQNVITKFCVPKYIVSHMLPCKLPEEKRVSHTINFSRWVLGRHLLSTEPASCSNEVAHPLYLLFNCLLFLH